METCLIKVIQNPKLAKTFVLEHTEKQGRTYLRVKFIISDETDLIYLANQLRRLLSGTFNVTNIEFNWQSAPRNIKQNQEFKKLIYQIFQPFLAISETDQIITPDKIRFYTDFVKRHISAYGNAPNFSDQTPKGQHKIHNYLKTTLGMPNLTLYEAKQLTPYFTN